MLVQICVLTSRPTLAQLVEHLTVVVSISLVYSYQSVAGSIPAGRKFLICIILKYLLNI